MYGPQTFEQNFNVGLRGRERVLGVKYEMKYGVEKESTNSISHTADNKCEEDILLSESLTFENFRSQGMKEREREQDGGERGC